MSAFRELNQILYEKHYNFLEQIPDRYKCLICHGLQKSPTLVSCCGQHFCDSCLSKWMLQSGHRCPHCQVRGMTCLVNKQQERDIRDLLVYCSNRDKGCDWVGTVATVELHVASGNFSTKQQLCQYQQVPCPTKCKLKIARRDLNSHLANGCLCRAYNCEYCGERGTYHTMTGECGEFGPCWAHKKGHYSSCGKYPIECPNKCSAVLRRGKMADHRAKCPLERVECSFSEMGCTTELVRRDVDNHLATSDHHHLLIMMKAFKELKTRTATLEQEKQELQTRVAALETQGTAVFQKQHSRGLLASTSSRLVMGGDKECLDDYSLACCFD